MVKMDKLKLENGELSDKEDSDLCDNLHEFFQNCPQLALFQVCDKEKYILSLAGTRSSSPNVAVNISDNTTEVFHFSDNFTRVATLEGHSDVLTHVKFSPTNDNLLCTSSNDGTVQLWDIRAPNRSTIQFKDTTVEENKMVKPLNCFDFSSNGTLLAAGTNVLESDSFILFWDMRKNTLLGGYWESHNDDITQVKFHPDDPNKLISGSVDGLINLYDLSQISEEDALIDSLNTESSIEKLEWVNYERKEIVGCVTHTANVQFWQPEGAEPYLHYQRGDLANAMKRKSENYVYVVDIHETINDVFVLTGSNYDPADCLRGLTLTKNELKPAFNFAKNSQIVRASWLNNQTNLLLTGGEKGVLNAWNLRKS